MISPVKKVQNIVGKLFKRKFIKGVVCTLLIFTAFGTIPETSTDPFIDEISSQVASTSLVQVADRTLSSDIISNTEDLSIDEPLAEINVSDETKPLKENDTIDSIQLNQDKSEVPNTSSAKESIDNKQLASASLIVKEEVNKEPLIVVEKDDDKQLTEKPSIEKQPDDNASNAGSDKSIVVDKNPEKPIEQDPPITTKPSNVNSPTEVSKAVGTDYIGNLNTKKFHYVSCGDVNRMKESNKFYYKGTREDMLSMGYSPCGHCHP